MMSCLMLVVCEESFCLLRFFFFFQAEDGIRDYKVTGVQTCALPISPGTEPALAQVEVQNRIKKAEARLPASVMQMGLQVEQASANFLMIYSLTYKDRKSVV